MWSLPQNGTVQCTDVSSECPTLACSPDEATLTDGNCCMECPSKKLDIVVLL